MINVNEIALREFCAPFYREKDIMHGLSHIDRIMHTANKISKDYPKADVETITLGAYLHGMVESSRPEVHNYLHRAGMPEAAIMQAAVDSLVDSIPTTIEGKILHDAHLLEGGKTFIITKCLVTGTARGQSLKETIAYIEDNILGKGKVYLVQSIAAYQDKQLFSREFIEDLKISLHL